jgi:flagellar basal body-associated protein FliL
LLIAFWAKAGRVGIAKVKASARVIIVCFFIASLFLILFLSAKVRQKSQTAQHLLFKYQSFSVFFCNFAAANRNEYL